MWLNYQWVKPICMTLLLLISAWHWGQAAIIYGKAYLAKWLIHHAWQHTLTTGKATKPWRWADTWPVAKIVFANKQSFYILAGGAGNSLAFGPGHLSETALPGTLGSSVIGGHRDTHFSLLKGIQKGEKIQVQNQRGEWTHYAVSKQWLADSSKENLIVDRNQNGLYLVTCYPFNTITPGGNQRFIVEAKEIFQQPAISIY